MAADLGISIGLDSSQYQAQLRVLTQQTQIATKQLSDAIGSVTVANQNLVKSGDSLGALNDRYKKLNEEIKLLAPNSNAFITKAAELRTVGQRIDSLNASIHGVNEELKKPTKGFFDGLKEGLGSITAVSIGNLVADAIKQIGAAILQFGKESVQAASQVQGINRALAFTAGGAEQGAQAYERFKDVANDLGISIEKNQVAYKNFVVSATQSGQSLNTAETEFKQVATAITAMGLSAEDSNGVLLALGQIASKGTVSAEELRGQIGERLPGAFAIAARSIGVTESKLGDMLKQGEVVSKDFLPKFTAELERTFGATAQSSVDSYAASLNKFDNQILDLKVSLGNELLPVLTEILTSVTDVIKTFKGLGIDLKDVFEVAAVSMRVALLPVTAVIEALFAAKRILNELGVSFNRYKGSADGLKELTKAQQDAADKAAKAQQDAADKAAKAQQDAADKAAKAAEKARADKAAKAAEKARKEAEKIGEAGSLGFLENQLKLINEQFQRTAENKLNVAELIGNREDIEAQIKRLKELYGILKEKPEAAIGSLNALKKQLSDINTEIDNAPKDYQLLTSLQGQTLVVQKQIDKLTESILRAKATAQFGLDFSKIQAIKNVPKEEAKTDDQLAAQEKAAAKVKTAIENIRVPKVSDEVIKEFDKVNKAIAASTVFASEQITEVAIKASAALGEGLAQTADVFGKSIADLVLGLGSFEDVLTNTLKSLGQTILVELPKVVGMGLVQSAFSPAGIAEFPANIPIALAGLALIGASGLIGGLLSGIGQKDNQQSIAQQSASAAQIGTTGASPQATAQGLGSNSAVNTQSITNVTVVLDTNGILTAIEKQQYINGLLTGG